MPRCRWHRQRPVPRLVALVNCTAAAVQQQAAHNPPLTLQQDGPPQDSSIFGCRVLEVQAGSADPSCDHCAQREAQPSSGQRPCCALRLIL